MAITLPQDAMAQLFGAAAANDLPQGPEWNVCPTTQVSVVVAQDGQRRLRAMRWGFIPQWYQSPTGGPLLINARAETIADKPAFRAACRARRCLIAADGFYEWERPEGRQPLPWFVRRADGRPMVFGGIWQDWSGPDGEVLSTCAIVTTEAAAPLSAIHDRVPVIVEPDNWPLWLGEAGKGAARLMQAPAEGVIEMFRVAPAVNSNRAKGPELIEPLNMSRPEERPEI